MEQRLAGPPGGGGSAGARCRFSGRPRSLPVAWRPRHYQSGGHGIRTHNRFPGTTFPVWPLTIRLPSKQAFFGLSTLLSPSKPDLAAPFGELTRTMKQPRFGRKTCGNAEYIQPSPSWESALVSLGLEGDRWRSGSEGHVDRLVANLDRPQRSPTVPPLRPSGRPSAPCHPSATPRGPPGRRQSTARGAAGGRRPRARRTRCGG